jgi:hypothetical protein
VPEFDPNTDISNYSDSLGIRISSKTESSKKYVVCSTELDDVAVDTSSFLLGTAFVYQKEHIRIFMDSTNLSVYVGGKCVYSYVLGFVNYPTDPVVQELSVHGAAFTIYNIQKTELHDYRDAVYIDYEATSDSALQSVIQERPVQIFAEPNRSLTFTYAVIKDILTGHHIKEYNPSVVAGSNLSSDGLIYFTNVSINTDQDTADNVGFLTRLYRLSNLETGAVQATQILQKMALERRYPMQIKCRFDPRVVIADQINVDKFITGTQTELVDECIVEDVQISIQDGQSYMTISGRRAM